MFEIDDVAQPCSPKIFIGHGELLGAVINAGGFVEFVSFEDDVLKVKMGGACSECDMTETTLQGWIAGTVRQFFPDIEDVVAV